MDALLVITTLPDAGTARALATQLVEQRLAACASIQSPCHSIYRWEGKIERTEEVTLLVKTRAARYPALEAAIRAGHPYELPEIVAVRIEAGLPAYLAWVAEETAAP